MSALVRRSEVTSERLVAVILKARDGGAEMPADLLAGPARSGRAAAAAGPGPAGCGSPGSSDREVEILRLVAEGLDTGEIARQLAFSERTIKSVLHDVTTRLQFATGRTRSPSPSARDSSWMRSSSPSGRNG